MNTQTQKCITVFRGGNRADRVRFGFGRIGSGLGLDSVWVNLIKKIIGSWVEFGRPDTSRVGF
jgi:uncharacterized protein YaeQ